MKRLLTILLALVILPSTIVLASSTYSADLSVSNNSSTAYPMLAVSASTNITHLVSQGYITASGLDTRIQNGGIDIPHMLASDRVTFAIATPANSNNTYQFVTGLTALDQFNIITGYGGYLTTTDSANLEPSANFTDTFSGYIDTTAGSGKYIFTKFGAVEGFVSPAVTGNITVNTYNGSLTWRSLVSTISAPSWTTPNNAWDGTIPARAQYTLGAGVWSDYLTLGTDNLSLASIRFHPDRGATSVNQVEIGIYYDESWTIIYSGNPTWADWNTVTANLTQHKTISQVRVRGFNSAGSQNFYVDEVEVGYYTPIGTISATGISSGEHIVTVRADNSKLFLDIDNVNKAWVWLP